MYKDNEENISKEKIDLSLIALQNSKIHVGIIGGGRASLIKAKTFLRNGARVTVVSREFLSDFKSLDSVACIKGEYDEKFILDKHLIVIAVDDEKDVLKIKLDCEKYFKLYINSHKGEDGNIRLSAQRNVGEMIVGVNTIGGNPKGAVFAVEKASKELEKYEEYISLTTILRKKCKKLKDKKNLLNFIGSEEFYLYYKQGKDKEIIEFHYGKEIAKKLFEGR